jgi:prolyl oligopeptidase
MLISTGDHDDRVVPLHSYKYVAELQYQAGDATEVDRPILIKVGADQGHSGG